MLRVGVGAVVVLLVWAAGARAAAPPPLSRDDAPADVASTYGSGAFGRWEVDEFGLPRFRYDVDETRDPRAKQPELAGGTLAQHQLGNDHIVANAYNDGYTQLWSQDREPQWANLYQADSKHYGGGYGWLQDGGRVIATNWGDAAPKPSRRFGVAYYARSLEATGATIDEKVYAPFGDDPLLLHDVTIKNTSSRPLSASWFEYWDVNPYYQTTGFQRNMAMDAPRWDASSRTLSVRQTGTPETDTDPLSIFAAALQGPVADVDTSVRAFFGDGTRALPAEVKAGKLSGTIAAPTADGQTGDVLFALRSPVSLAPGESVTLRYAYGMAHDRQIAALVAKRRTAADGFAASERAWADWLPRADLGASRTWVARELAWDAYLLRSASVFEEVCGYHTITQGGYYQYVNGANLGYRSWLHYALPITWTAPDLAREILRYAIQWQPEAGKQNPYGTGPLCNRVDLGTSNDLDFWLLLAAGEYGLAMRDTKFFDEQLPFWDTKRKVSAWEHIKLAYEHQESLLGPHGGYVMGSTGDWSDFSTQFLQATESMLVTAQTAYAYPKLAELAELRGDTEFAKQLRASGARDVATLRREWTGKGWYSRGYSGDRQIGAGLLFEEPQPWAMLAGAPTGNQAKTLQANIRRFLGGVGAPKGPARYGSAQVPGRDDPDVTQRWPTTDPLPNNAPLQGAAAWPGGVWFDLNGHLTWAYAERDEREAAWDEYTRNTLANHATLWPDHWDGTISVDDVCYGYYSAHPDYCGNGLTTAYEGQITEQPTWMVMNALRLAGVTVGREGYRIAPHYPFDRFSLRMPRVGVASAPGVLRGYVKPESSDAGYALTVRVPVRDVTTWVDGRAVAHAREGDSVRFNARGAADWAVTWGGGARSCTSRRRFVIRLRGPHGERLRSARVFVAGKRVRTRRGMRALVDLRGRPKQRTTVRIVGVTRRGRHVVALRRYRLCVKKTVSRSP